MNGRLKRWVVWLEAAVAVLIGLLSAWLIYFSYDQAAREKATIGHAVDAGAITYVVTVICFLPTALLFGVAALSSFRNWRISWALQILAIGWVAVVIIGILVGYFP